MLAPDAVDASLVDLGGLPRPEQDPAVLRAVQEIGALEAEAIGLAAEVRNTTAARAGAEDQAVVALAAGDADATREAEGVAARLGASLLEARGRLRAIGAHLGALEAERHAALAAACRGCADAWKHAEQVLGASLSEVETRATEIKHALAEVASVRRQLDQVTGPGEPVAVRFVRCLRPYGVGEVATFSAAEAARLVGGGAATFVDVWRRLAAGGRE